MIHSVSRLLLLALAVPVAGCTVTAVREVPIIEKSEHRGGPPPSADAPAATTPPPASREAKGGVYVVQRGDTLYSIALAFGHDHRDLARWNGLSDPARLQVGQSLRIEAPPGETAMAEVAAVPVAPVAAAEVRPLDQPRPLPPVQPAPVAPAAGAKSAAPAAGATPSRLPQVAVEPSLGWTWPAAGSVIETFNETRNKGIDIAGSEGDAVLAANEGSVVYSGSGLRGYGNLVIIKHTDDFISAYAHNKQILVKQGQSVKRGQRIAELGRTDAEISKLHFEIRRQGKPVDPLRFLPER